MGINDVDSFVLAAIITAAGALLAALVSLIAVLVSRRATAQANRQLEVLKRRLDSYESTRVLKDVEHAATLSALGKAVRSIQSLRDALLLMLSSGDKGMKTKEALELLSRERELVMETYGETLPNLSDNEKRVFHSTKHVAVKAVEEFRWALRGRGFVSELDLRHRQRIESLRTELLQAQQSLESCRMDRVSERLRS